MLCTVINVWPLGVRHSVVTWPFAAERLMRLHAVFGMGSTRRVMVGLPINNPTLLSGRDTPPIEPIARNGRMCQIAGVWAEKWPELRGSNPGQMGVALLAGYGWDVVNRIIDMGHGPNEIHECR